MFFCHCCIDWPPPFSSLVPTSEVLILRVPLCSYAAALRCINGPEREERRPVGHGYSLCPPLAASTNHQSTTSSDLKAFAMAMEHGRTNLTEAVRSVHLLEIDGYCATAAMSSMDYIKSRWNVHGHQWEVRVHPNHWQVYKGNYASYVAFSFALLNELPEHTSNLKANLSCRLVDPRRNLDPSAEKEKSVSCVFTGSDQSSSLGLLLQRNAVKSSGYLIRDSLTVQCTITVLKDLPVPDIVIPASTELPLPPSDLHQHLGELLQSQKATDVTFSVSGESFAAHKLVLAARSPVFMAEFFGQMGERSSRCVRITDMEPAAFRAMLHFIYTDTAPELDGQPLEAAAMAQHLLAAADRYGLDRLKLICEAKLSGCIGVETAATMLALAEQHNCSLLKARFVAFIAGSPETLDAVVATDGYRHLVASCPLVLTELLKAAHARNN